MKSMLVKNYCSNSVLSLDQMLLINTKIILIACFWLIMSLFSTIKLAYVSLRTKQEKKIIPTFQMGKLKSKGIK